MRRLSIRISEKSLVMLLRLAEKERRDVRQQAAWIIERALQKAEHRREHLSKPMAAARAAFAETAGDPPGESLR